MREFLRYTLMNILGMMGLSCYILADTFFVSKGLGADGLTALNLALPVYNLIHGLGLMMGIGGAVRYSVLKSQNNTDEADRAYTHTVLITIVLAAIIVLAGILGAGKIAAILGAEGHIWGMTTTYIRVMMIFAPAFMMNDVCICFIRNDGVPHLSMISMLIGSFANLIMDYIFIFPCGLGILGAVMATGFAPVIGICIMSTHVIRGNNQFHFRRLALSPRLSGHILAAGASSFVTEMSSGIVIIVFNMIILKLAGNVGVAAYGIIANISMVVMAMYTGISEGMQPLVSRYYGRGDSVNDKRMLRYAVIMVFVLSVVIEAAMVIGAENAAAVFNSEGSELLQSIAVHGIRIYFMGCMFAGINIVMCIYFAATGREKQAGVLSAMRGFLLIVPMTFLLSWIWKISGVWMAFPVTECIVVILGWILYRSARKKS